MAFIAICRYQDGDGIELIAADETEFRLLIRVYELLQKNGTLEEFRSNFSEYGPEDKKYNPIDKISFVKDYTKYGKKYGYHITIKEDHIWTP